jgi:hypothetical protein
MRTAVTTTFLVSIIVTGCESPPQKNQVPLASFPELSGNISWETNALRLSYRIPSPVEFTCEPFADAENGFRLRLKASPSWRGTSGTALIDLSKLGLDPATHFPVVYHDIDNTEVHIPIVYEK